MATTTAKDLTTEFPRSPLDELAGFPWLPRLIDKVRALQAGKIGEYTPYPCGGDRSFLAAVGVDADALKQVIDGGAGDAEIGAWVQAHAQPGFEPRLAEYRQRQVNPIPAGTEVAGYLEEAKKELAAARPGLDVSKVDNFAKLICLEEGHPCPGL